MKNTIGIRREDLSKKGERRVAIPPRLAKIMIEKGANIWVQPAHHPETNEQKRAFNDAEYTAVGAEIREDIKGANAIFGLKEIELNHIIPNVAYYFFSHTHKGQEKNRKMLRTLVERKNTVIDYELVMSDKKEGLVAFSFFAGYAGMIDSLWTYGKRVGMRGIEHPFAKVPQSIEKEDLELIKGIVREVGEEIKANGTPDKLPPMICCVLGKGRASIGAQAIYDLLPVKEITLAELEDTFHNGSRNQVYKLVLDVPEMYRLKATAEYSAEAYAALSYKEKFQLYINEPQHFESNLDQAFPYISMLMNCILWTTKYPRLLTRSDAKKWYAKDKTLEVIGDITCDPDGAIHFSKDTWIDDPVFIYHPDTDMSTNGFEGEGIAVMAVTNLPCEFPADASNSFSKDVEVFIDGIVSGNYEAETLEESGLPIAIQRGVIMWHGKFTPPYTYMEAYL